MHYGTADLAAIKTAQTADILYLAHPDTSVVTAATAITALTPSRSDDIWLDRILRVLNVLAGNVGFNRNADES